MISLSGVFWYRRLVLRGLFALGLLQPFSAPAIAAECNESPVYAFSRALYQQHYSRAEALLDRVENERDVQTAEFLRQVLHFSQGYLRSDRAGVRGALQALDELIDAFPGKAPGQSTDAEQLDRASIQVHAARMHLANGNLLRAVNLAKAAGPVLLADIEPGDLSDALLARGLYQYYAGRGDDDLGWVIGLFGFKGDKVAGTSNIGRAVLQSPDHAFEAARSLVSDLGWNRQQLCPVLPAFDRATSPGHLDPLHYQQQIAAFFFCGDPLQSLSLIEAAEGKSKTGAIRLSSAQQEWLFDARLQTFAALGDTLQLREMLDEAEARTSRRAGRIRFALARALDVQGQHDQAKVLYTEFLKQNPGEPYVQLAKQYRAHGFRAPAPYDRQVELPLLMPCSR